MELRGRPLPEHLIRQIRRMRRSNTSIRDIAKMTGVSSKTVMKYLSDDAPDRQAEADSDGR